MKKALSAIALSTWLLAIPALVSADTIKSAAQDETPSANRPSEAPSRPSLEDIVNNAKESDLKPVHEVSPAVLRAEVMLDRVHVSPG